MGKTKEAREDERGGMAGASETKAGASQRTQRKRARTSSSTNAPDTDTDTDTDASLDPSPNEVMNKEDKGAIPRRWSPEEDERLRASVEKHEGTNWKQIAREVRTRTHVQCLQRWNKVLTPGLVKGPWSAEEDQLLLSVMTNGRHKNWGSLSARVPGRTSKQCRERWCHHLDPRIVKCQWTAAEDEIIVSMQKRIGNKWAEIARHLDGRTENAAKTRWKILERQLKREADERDKEEAPVAVLGDHGETSDDVMGLPRRVVVGKAGLQGGHIHLSPSTAVSVDRRGRSGSTETRQDRHDGGRRAWLAEEDERLKKAVEVLGERNWPEVALHVRTRDRVQCQQRWKKALRPGLVKGTWNDEEDEQLIDLVMQGFPSWSKLAANTRRTPKQCRERWTHHLDPSLRHGSWTPEEDQLLVTLEARLGKKWAAIAREIPGRTEHAIKGRFKALSKETSQDMLVGSRENCVGIGWMDRQPASPNATGAQEAPVPPSLGERRGIVRVVSSVGVGSMDTSGLSRNGNGATWRADAPSAGRGFFMDEAVGNASVAGAMESVGQHQRWLNLDIGAQHPAKTMKIAAPPVAPTTAGVKGGDEESIARLLSVSSVRTDPNLSDVRSGYCGRHTGGTTSTGTTSPSSSVSDLSSLVSKQSDMEPRLPGAEVGEAQSLQAVPLQTSSPRVSDGHTSDSAGDGTSLSLVDAIDDTDFADVASMLMDGGFDACKDGVDSESEEVTLGEDPYIDYALAADGYVTTARRTTGFPTGPAKAPPVPPQQQAEEQNGVSFDGPIREDVAGTSSPDLADFLPASLFDGEDADDDAFDPNYLRW